MSKLQPPRGTKDILPDEYRIFANIEKTARKTGQLYGYQQMASPIFEFTDVFKRTLGESSDVVNKEMYSFESKGGDNLTLRPEFTASIARGIISGGQYQNMPLKYYSVGPLFRYERPQKGRQRQFHQLNFERFGEIGAHIDAETIAMGYDILSSLGLADKIELQINSLGDDATRKNYLAALVDYLSQYEADLSEDSKRRLTTNPMRILDSKDEGDRKIIANAPVMSDYYSDEAKQYFADVLSLLPCDYKVNPHLVRGLDYYSHTVFEFIATEGVGAQSAILSGGRYDGLIELMGGKQTPAIGFAAGMERLMLLCDAPIARTIDIAIFGRNNGNENELYKLAQCLRAANISCEIISSGKYDKKFKKAESMGAKHALIYSDDGLMLHNLSEFGDAKQITIDELIK